MRESVTAVALAGFAIATAVAQPARATFEVVSVYPAHTPRGLQHIEATLQTVSGGVPSG